MHSEYGLCYLNICSVSIALNFVSVQGIESIPNVMLGKIACYHITHSIRDGSCDCPAFATALVIFHFSDVITLSVCVTPYLPIADTDAQVFDFFHLFYLAHIS